MSQVIYSQPGWSSPFLGRGNSVGPPALSGVIMFSVKHNQSPRSQPLYKPRGPPQSIPAGWVTYHCGLTTERRWAEPSRARRQTAGWILMQTWGEARWWPACQAMTDLLWANTGKGGGGGGGSRWEAVVFYQLFTPFELESEGMCKCSRSDKIYGRVKVIFFSPLRVSGNKSLSLRKFHFFQRMWSKELGTHKEFLVPWFPGNF